MSQKGVFYMAMSLLLSAVILHVVNPLGTFIEWQASFREGTALFKYWKYPPSKVMLMFHIFNYTNSEAFLRGEEKLQIQELGPYAYQEFVEFDNVTFNGNKTFTYIPRNFLVEDRNLTVGDLREDIVTVPNLALLGIASAIADSSDLTNVGFSILATSVRSQPFLTMTVHDYLTGYEEPLLKYAQTMLPGTNIPVGKVAVMDMFSNDKLNVVTASTRVVAELRGDGSVTEPLTIDVYNGLSGLPHFGYVEGDNSTHLSCNTLKGLASEGGIIPRKIKSTDKFMLYRQYYCRTLPFQFGEYTTTSKGIPAMYFNISGHAFNNSVHENSCYCRANRRGCLPDGITDVGPCVHDLPIAISAPHFLFGDRKLVDAWEGLSPSKDKHNSYVVLDSTFGVMTTSVFRIQTNLALKKLRYSTMLKPLSDMTLPLTWTEHVMDDLPGMHHAVLYLAVFVVPVFHVVFVTLFAFSGIAMLLLFCKRVIWL